MTRPTVGGSDGTWGTELNAYLDVSLDDDGKVDDGAAQTTSAAPGADAELVNKKYTDDHAVFGAYTREDDDTANMVQDHAYLANQDGNVTAYAITGTANGDTLRAFIGASSDPAGAGDLIQAQSAAGTSFGVAVSMPVANGKYFEITLTGSATAIIRWHPVGTLIKPTDQN